MIRRLATLDMGVMLMPEEIVADELASGKLRRIMPDGTAHLCPSMPLPKPAFSRRRRSDSSSFCESVWVDDDR